MPTASDDAVRRAAYARWEARGQPPRDDWSDWFCAEKWLQDAASSDGATRACERQEAKAAQDESARLTACTAETWLCLLVHGVGDHDPGAMIDEVTGAIRTIHPDLPERKDFAVVNIADPAAPDGRFSLFTRDWCSSGGRRAVLGEIFWADLSRIHGGTFDLLVRILRLIFGLRYISERAAGDSGWTAWLLRCSLYVTVLLARGPWLALIVLGLAYISPLLIQGGAEYVDIAPRWVAWLTGDNVYFSIGLIVAAAGVGMMLRARSKGTRPGAFPVSLTLCGLAGTFYLTQPLLRLYISNLYERELRMGPAFYIAATIDMTDWARDLAYTCLGISAIPMILAVVFAKRRHAPALFIAYLAAAFQLLLWQTMLGVPVIIIDWGLASVTPRIGRTFAHDAIFYNGLRVLFLCSIASVVMATWAVRIRWARRHEAPTTSSPPRLIIGAATQAWILVIAILLASDGMIMAMGVVADLAGFQLPAAANRLLDVLDRIIVDLAAPVGLITFAGVIYVLVSETVARMIVHVITDVANHFYRPSEDFPVRRQIENRFRTVFQRLVDAERPTRITVIAHSQGSMIAFDALTQIVSADWFRPHIGRMRIDVVTVGSPLTHLYQHYFPFDYPPCDDPKWSKLRPVVRSWYNVYRVDDYVGTFVTTGSEAPERQDWPKNIPAKPGGHTDYWKEDIFGHLGDVVP
jgi:Protein of unknown function (DUF2934)